MAKMQHNIITSRTTHVVTRWIRSFLVAFITTAVLYNALFSTSNITISRGVIITPTRINKNNIIVAESSGAIYSANTNITSTASIFACPTAKMDLTCTEWMTNALIDDTIIPVPQGTMITKKNATSIKLCEYTNPLTEVNWLGEDYLIAPPSGFALLKCDNALIQFGNKWSGGSITCGIAPPNVTEDGIQVHSSTDVLFATALAFPNIMQHVINPGLNFGTLWNIVKDPNVLILTGDVLKGFYTQLVGKERVLINTVQASKWFFRSIYFGHIPSQIIPLNNQTHAQNLTEAVEMAKHIQRDGDEGGGSAMLPCSIRYMNGFEEWRSNFTSKSQPQQTTPHSTNYTGTLLYLQRLNTKRACVYWDCGKRDSLNETCNCAQIPEEEFIKHLGDLGRRHGLEVQVFRHSTLQKDAEMFAKASVVVGPHGGAFANIIFMDPNLYPLMIEANLHKSMHECCNVGNSPARLFFAHLASSLGIQYRSYQPHVWRKYGGKSAHVSLEVNEYLDYIDKAISNSITDPKMQISAPLHPCVSHMT